MALIAILAGDIGPIFSYVGAIASNSIAYALPFLFFIRLYKKRNFLYYLVFVLLVISIILALVCIVCEGLSKK